MPRIYKKEPVKVRFLKRIQDEMKKGTDACWEWPGGRLPWGYGRIGNSDDPSLSYTHRLSYSIFVGPIPQGMLVCHTCDNPPCCNPKHLFVGTISDNSKDMIAKKRHPQNLPKTFCKNGHELAVHGKQIKGQNGRYCGLCKTEYHFKNREKILKRRKERANLWKATRKP